MKKTLCMILILALIFGLTACGKTTDVPDLPSVPSTPDDSASIEEGVTHMTKVLCEGLEIDADIPSFSALSLPTFETMPLVVSPSDAVNLFMGQGNREIAAQKKHEYDPNGFTITMEQGQEIYHINGILSYESETSAKDREICDVLESYAQAHPEEKVRDLSFMSPQEAIEQGKQLMKKLNMIGNPDMQSGKIVGLSGQEIMEWQSKLLEDDEYQVWVDIGKITKLTDLTSEDDAYLLSFNFTYQGIPMFNQDSEPSISSASDGFPPSSTKAYLLISARGLRYFELQGGVSANGSASQPQAIISAEDALNELAQQYEDTIQFGVQRITEVWLEYIPRSASGVQGSDAAITLTPYWCFRTVSLDDVSGDAIEGDDNAARFNAITGKDLAYGG